MTRKGHPVTPAMRVLERHGVPFDVLPYRYEEHGGTRSAARELGVDEHAMIKTLIMETDAGRPLVVLMHGDRQVSTKELARCVGVKSVRPCDPEVANRHSGYLVGGTSPFGTRRPMPVYAEATIFDLAAIYINAGHRGLMLRLAPRDAEKALPMQRCAVAIP
jgi:Cys-tRNA(Pro) deacylase